MGRYKIITNFQTFFISATSKIHAYSKAVKKLKPKEIIEYNIPYDKKAIVENL